MTLEKVIECCQKYPVNIESFWYALSHSQTLTEEMIIEYAEYLDWDLISEYQTLSENLIDRFADRLNWLSLVQFQILSEKFLEKHMDKISNILFEVLFQQQVSEEFVLKHLSNLINYEWSSLNACLDSLKGLSKDQKWNFERIKEATEMVWLLK